MTLLSDESTKSQSYELLYLAVEKAIRYVDSVRQRRVSLASSALAALSRYHEPFPSGSCNPTEVLKQLDALGSPATAATTGGRYFGFVNGGMVPAALAASWMAAAWNQNAALRVMSPVAAENERLPLQARRRPANWTATRASYAMRWRIRLVQGTATPARPALDPER